MPATDGIDICGVVVAIGRQCKRLKVGNEVWGKGPAPTRFGTFATFVAVPEEVLFVKPQEISFVDGGSLGIAALTSYQALFVISQVKKDEKILIIGGSGGTGTFLFSLSLSSLSLPNHTLCISFPLSLSLLSHSSL